MGDIVRMNDYEKIVKLKEKEMDKEEIIILISGGVPELIKNTSGKQILLIDVDNLDIDMEDKHLDEQLEDSGSYYYL